MKIQEVILRARAKKITWWQAAEIIGISDRQMRRIHERYEESGYDGLFDRRRGKPSPKRVPLAIVQQVLRLYREHSFDPSPHDATSDQFFNETRFERYRALERAKCRRLQQRRK